MPHNNAHPQSQPNRSPPRNQPQAKPQPQQGKTGSDPRENDKGLSAKPGFENEGEGNWTAARNYEAQTESYIKSGSVEHAAREAKQALEGAEGEELRRAEEIGREGEPSLVDSSLEDTKPDGKNARGR
jgi:hypothetical protein